jgi:hypothetical protein
MLAFENEANIFYPAKVEDAVLDERLQRGIGLALLIPLKLER